MQAKKKRRNSGARTVLYMLAIGIWYYRWYILAVLLGAFFTPMAVKAAYAARGYRAIGGEVLLIPLFVLMVKLVSLVKQLFEMLAECVDEESEEQDV